MKCFTITGNGKTFCISLCVKRLRPTVHLAAWYIPELNRQKDNSLRDVPHRQMLQHVVTRIIGPFLLSPRAPARRHKNFGHIIPFIPCCTDLDLVQLRHSGLDPESQATDKMAET